MGGEWDIPGKWLGRIESVVVGKGRLSSNQTLSLTLPAWLGLSQLIPYLSRLNLHVLYGTGDRSLPDQ